MYLKICLLFDPVERLSFMKIHIYKVYDAFEDIKEPRLSLNKISTF